MKKLAILLIGTLLSPCIASEGEASSDRFALVINGEAVNDNQTGLIWEREPSSSHMIWSDAAGHCEARSVGGEKGWRVPTIKELSSLVDTSQSDPALPLSHPFMNIKSAVYWSGTPSENDDIVAWHVSFFRGEAMTDQKSQTRRVWCVRRAK